MPGPRIAQTFNGTEGWMGPLGAVPGGMLFRFGGPGGPGGGPGGPVVGRAAATGPGGPAASASIRRHDRKQTYWRTALAMLPGTERHVGLTFTYVGQGRIDRRQGRRARRQGRGNFTARLFVDAKTHLPVMLTYQERERG